MDKRIKVFINKSTNKVVIVTDWDTYCEDICGWPECKSIDELRSSTMYKDTVEFIDV